MRKYYDEPKLVIYKFNICHSIFTDSGDNLHDDDYNVTLNAHGTDGIGNDVFGD